MKNFLKYFVILFLIALNSFSFYLLQYTPQYKPAMAIVYRKMVCNFSNDIKTQFPNAYLYKYLNTYFKKYGFELQCSPTNTLQNSSLNFIGVKWFKFPPNITAPSYLWIEETPFSAPLFYPIKENEQNYRKIFTYSKKLVDNKKYFYLPLPYDYNRHVLSAYPKLADKNILIAQVASNNYSLSHLEQYSERRKAVAYFVKNHPEDFLLYGGGWKRMLPFFNETEKQAFTRLYKGPILEKKTAFIPAKFVLAYENAIFDDYISEKILDAMAFGAVPVYLGASNITDYVPKDCFINRKEFSSYDELYNHLKNMPDETYEKYLTCMESFMKRKSHFNDYDTFAKLLLPEIFDTEPFWKKLWFHFYAFLKETVLSLP